MSFNYHSISCLFFLGIEIYVYIYVLDSAVLQYIDIFARIFLDVACVGSLCGIFWLEYFDRLIVWAAPTGIFWLSAAPVCQVVLACFVNLSQKPAAEKVTNNQLYSVARFNIIFSLKIQLKPRSC